MALPHRRSWYPLGFIREARERKVADHLIRKLGVRCRGSHDTLDLLSGGNQQKVVIGRWQAAPCRLLLLDEPFQGVDVGARRDIVDAIRSDLSVGATLIATSDVEEAIEVANIVAVMRGHSIVGLHDLRTNSGESLIAAIAALETDESEKKREGRGVTADIDAKVVSARSAPGFDVLGRTLRRYAIFIILAALIVFFHFAEPAFLRVNNLFSVLQSVAVVALLAVGVTVTLAVDGFDLSIGSIAAFTLMASSYAMVVWQFGATATIGFALATGAVIGAINGLLIVGLRIPDLLATLGMMFLLAGLELIPSAGRSITAGLILSDGSVAQGAFDPAFLAVGRRQLFGVAPLPVVIVAVIAVVCWFLMERTRWGRVFYAVGGNETAAYLAGAPVKTYRVVAYMISGVLAALGGVFIAARVGRGDVFAGSSLTAR